MLAGAEYAQDFSALNDSVCTLEPLMMGHGQESVTRADLGNHVELVSLAHT